MDDNRSPFFPPEALAQIRKGKVFSGGIDVYKRQAIPGAKTVRVLLRREDAGHEAHLRAAAPEVELSFAEGKFELGGMIIEFPMQHRRADLTFDTALEDLSSRFTEITGFGMEDSDGK